MIKTMQILVVWNECNLDPKWDTSLQQGTDGRTLRDPCTKIKFTYKGVIIRPIKAIAHYRFRIHHRYTPTSVCGDLWENSVKILVFPSPTSYSCEFPFSLWEFEVYSIYSSTTISYFPEILMNFSWFFSNSTDSSVTSDRFSVFIDPCFDSSHETSVLIWDQKFGVSKFHIKS